MVWGSISHKGVVSLFGIGGNMYLQYYFNVLKDNLVNVNEIVLDGDWMLQQDRASVRTLYYTKK